jgi:DNA-binding Xre family transcriptional regulator
MSALIEYEIIKKEGEPDRALVDYKQLIDLLALVGDRETVPHEVVRMVHGEADMSPVKAWRLYKEVSQQELAEAAGMSQPGLQQIESKPFETLRKKTREKLAAALDITLEQLDV